MITYFKVVYRRHTNFAMESIQQTFNGNVSLGQRVTAQISRNGDLVSGMHLEVNLPATINVARGYRNDVGHHLVQQVEIEIGGQLIDRHYSDWLEIWAQLTVPADKRLGYRLMIGQDPVTNGGAVTGLQSVAFQAASRPLYIPLQFWFCRNVGLALPLIALQYHEVKVNVTFNTFANIAQAGAEQGTGFAATLWVDYIYLDTDERRRFAQVSHEYLIEQLQFSGNQASTIGTNTVVLNFNHPVKELVWVNQATDNAAQPSDYGNTVGNMTALDNFASAGINSVNPVTSAKLMLNGQDRFASRAGNYFSRVQPNEHHTCIPLSAGINVYSFALKPEEHQPSGTCNFSRIDNAKLELNMAAAAGTLKVFATNYNVLRVMSGMGGLAYSN
jgi:hypothetical protein